jgi:hypothetical protein
VVEGLPSGSVGEMFPVVVRPIGVGMLPSAEPGAIAAGDIVVANDIVVAVAPGIGAETLVGAVDDSGKGVGAIKGDGRGGTGGGCGAGTVELGKSLMNDVAGCADKVSDGELALPAVEAEEAAGAIGVVVAEKPDCVGAVVPPVADMDVTATVAVPGAICPVGVKQLTTVPGVEGSEASGTGASVVSGAPGWVVAENGLGPLSGEVTIVPGVDESPMAVLPMVETCARPALVPSSRAAPTNSKRRIAMASFATI